jgi:hypothetical protein
MTPLDLVILFIFAACIAAGAYLLTIAVFI